ncbi:unnamed protein product [Agarophyton chilense]
MSGDVIHEPELSRFTIKYADVDEPAFLSYVLSEDGTEYNICHTYTPPSVRGRGVAGKLVRHAIAYVREKEHKIIPTCSVVAKRGEPESYVLAESQLEKVEDILQHKFVNRAVLAEALTHRSVVNASSSTQAFYEHAGKKIEIHRNNERLELLGDRVFGLVVVQALFKRDPDASEGKLSPTSQIMVSRKSAKEHSFFLGLHSFLLEQNILRGKEGSRYGDSFEALLGALFLDGGYDAAFQFYSSRIMPLWDRQLLGAPNTSCRKQYLQEYLVQMGLPAPSLGTQLTYVTKHYDKKQKIFIRAIKLFGREVSAGKGTTVQSADQAAALVLYTRLKRLKEGRVTCFLIRLARHAADQDSLTKLQQTKLSQTASASEVLKCYGTSQPKSA